MEHRICRTPLPSARSGGTVIKDVCFLTWACVKNTFMVRGPVL